MAENKGVYPALAGLDERQRRFVREIVSGRSIIDSARAAGYGESVAYRVRRQPAVAAAIEAELYFRLRTEAAPLALDTVIDLVKNATSERVKLDASRVILDRAGFVPPTKTASDDGQQKQLADMSQEELKAAMDKTEAEIDQIEAELAARATPVNAPNGIDITLKPKDILA